jgi:hypothetical protein
MTSRVVPSTAMDSAGEQLASGPSRRAAPAQAPGAHAPVIVIDDDGGDAAGPASGRPRRKRAAPAPIELDSSEEEEEQEEQQQQQQQQQRGRRKQQQAAKQAAPRQKEQQQQQQRPQQQQQQQPRAKKEPKEKRADEHGCTVVFRAHASLKTRERIARALPGARPRRYGGGSLAQCGRPACDQPRQHPAPKAALQHPAASTGCTSCSSPLCRYLPMHLPPGQERRPGPAGTQPHLAAPAPGGGSQSPHPAAPLHHTTTPPHHTHAHPPQRPQARATACS